MSVSRLDERPRPRTGVAVELHPIIAADLPEVARFLHDELDPRVPAGRWAAQIVPTWAVDQPNYGFLLRCRGQVVGAHLAYYCERPINGVPQRFCNLAAWCVAEPYRSHGVRLLRALLRQQGYHFTDLSPSQAVRALNERLGFAPLDTSTVVVANLGLPVRARGVQIVSDRRRIEQLLRGEALALYRDHAGAAAVRHAVILRGAKTCHVMYRRVRRKNLPLFAALVYVGDRELFRAAVPQFLRHLLLRHGLPAVLIEAHVAGSGFARPMVVCRPVSERPKMYRSDTLAPAQIDYLYSELTGMQW